MSDRAMTDYELVVGLEIHVQLNTRSKIFSADPTIFGKDPNENISVITLAHPGTLPKLNKEVIDLAMKMGLACESEISREFIFDRKNYFYPDLPKGYQLTQDRTPICMGGYVPARLEGGSMREVKLHKIHLEEDAGKSMHDIDPKESVIDFNRAGVPLIEIVTEPDIYSAEEAMATLAAVRRLVRYLGISEANMEEGSMRCDANISVRPKGAEALGKKVEIKNMNSLRNVSRAIKHEFSRQSALLQEGKSIVSETRTFNAQDGSTAGMRMKEELNDYRYFPEPDLSAVRISDDHFDRVKESMPELPEAIFHRFTQVNGLPVADAAFLVEEQSMAEFATKLFEQVKNAKQAANWLMGPIQSVLKDLRITIADFPLTIDQLVQILELVTSGQVSNSAASQQLLPALLKSPTEEPRSLARALNLIQESDEGSIQPAIDEVIASFPDKVKEYQRGKKGLLGMFMGEVMKKTNGKVDPKVANRLVRESLESLVS